MTTTPAMARLDAARPLPGLFRLVAAEQPDTIAVIDDGRTLTYAELDRASDRLAARLAHAVLAPATWSACSWSARPTSPWASSAS
ncbi:hypothetical protein SALBM311S_13007 [Streptomyces alboniger]